MANPKASRSAVIHNQKDMLAIDAGMAVTYSHLYDKAYEDFQTILENILSIIQSNISNSINAVSLPSIVIPYKDMQVLFDHFVAIQNQVNEDVYDKLLQYQQLFVDMTITSIEKDVESSYKKSPKSNPTSSQPLHAFEDILSGVSTLATAVLIKKLLTPKRSSQSTEISASSFFKGFSVSEISEQSRGLSASAKAALLPMENTDDTITVKQNIAFHRPNKQAIKNIIGTFDDGSPIHPDHFGIPQNDWERIKQTIIQGVIAGENSDKIAGKIQGIHESMKQRAIGLARTEMFNAHRRASHETYVANDDILDGWTWLAHLSPRTCAVCWARHGKKFTTKQMMKAHVSCRCTQIPNIKGHPLDIISGEDAFAKLSEKDQLTVLGPTKMAMYQKGNIKLDDLVGMAVHPRFGEYPYEKPLKQLKMEGFSIPEPSEKSFQKQKRVRHPNKPSLKTVKVVITDPPSSSRKVGRISSITKRISSPKK